jgi:hypothetical protein
VSGPRNVIPVQVSREDLSETVSLGHAKAWLRSRVGDGALCPCCGQMAKVYRRRIHQTIARALIDLYLLGKEEEDYWVHVPSRISPACEVGKARYWDLVEEASEKRADGGRAGWWRLTDHGVMFVRGLVTIPLHARIYDGRCLGFEGEQVTIADAVGSKFDYAALMAGDDA